MGCPGDSFRAVDPILADQLDYEASCGAFGGGGTLYMSRVSPTSAIAINLPPVVTLPPAVPASSAFNPFAGSSLSLPAGSTSACDGLSEPWKTLCKLGGTALGGGPATPTTTLSNVPITSGCPTGFVLQNGRCVQSGVDQYIPGPIGTLQDYGPAVIGAFGKPALTPKQVGSIKRKDGVTGPILRCPAGMVLGRDDLCYQKGAITNKERAHPRGHRPLITGGEMHAFSVARAASKKLRKLANRFAPTHHRKAPPSKKK